MSARRWMIRDYDILTGECITTKPIMFWTQRGAEKRARLLGALTHPREGRYQLRVERLP